MLCVHGCNVVAILSMADMVCLECRNCECMSWVCMVCQSKLCCEILLLLNIACKRVGTALLLDLINSHAVYLHLAGRVTKYLISCLCRL